MLREIYLYKNKNWSQPLNGTLDSDNTLIICFGSTDYSAVEQAIEELYALFKQSTIIGCSTAGEIYQDELNEGTLSVAIIKFERSTIKCQQVHLNNADESFDVGLHIAQHLSQKDLKAIFILSDGLNINGSALTHGINSHIDNTVVVTGGLAADNDQFETTWILGNQLHRSHCVVAIGFYGNDFHIAYGSEGGWSHFGINRTVTKSDNNILYELDHQPALKIYKNYLGDNANKLPSSGLLYPLMITGSNSEEEKVRTILAVDEEKQSITFAGDIPIGSQAIFMKASVNELIQGAKESTLHPTLLEHQGERALNIAISCVGRRLVLGQKTEEEIEAVINNLHNNTLQIGYYSYGEISPLRSGECDLHNQTMTLTLIWETEHNDKK